MTERAQKPGKRPFVVLRWWRFWVALFSRREPGLGLACFRIAIGLVALYSLASVGLAGLIEVLWVDVAHGGYKPLGTCNWLLSELGGPRPEVVYPLYAAAVVSVVLFTVGLGGPIAGRAIALVTLQLYLALTTINNEASGGYDILISNALWLCVLGDTTTTLSVRCWIANRGFTCTREVLAWPRYLAVFQLLLVYFATGLYKLTAAWTPAGGYIALFRVFQDPTWRRFDMDWTAWVTPVTQVATAVTWLFEICAPLLLLVYYFRLTRDRPGRLRALMNRRDLRIVFAGVGLSLHVGILLTLDVGPFSWVTMSYYLCLWHPDELARIGQRMRHLRLGVRCGDDSARHSG